MPTLCGNIWGLAWWIVLVGVEKPGVEKPQRIEKSSGQNPAEYFVRVVRLSFLNKYFILYTLTYIARISQLPPCCPLSSHSLSAKVPDSSILRCGNMCASEDGVFL